MIDFDLIIVSLPQLLRGALVTLQISGMGCLLGVVFGTIFGVVQARSSSLFSGLVSVYATVIRGTPMLIQIFIFAYVLPQFGIVLSSFWAATLAIGVNSSAYVSQIIRSGIQAVGSSQVEAGRVLGFSQLQITRFIILPQALRAVLPVLGNELITLVKDSSLASTIGVMELTKEAAQIRSITFDAISPFFAVAIIYLLITSALSLFVVYLERRMNTYVAH